MLLVAELERHTATAQVVAATLLAAGAKGVEIPGFGEKRDEFDAALVEPPDPARANDARLHELGVA